MTKKYAKILKNLWEVQMYLNYINYFRGFAILMVVLGHFLYFPESTVTEKLVKAVIKGGISPFVFISGFLFHHIFYRRGFDYKKFMKNKFKNVLLPYTIVVIPGLIYVVSQHNLDSYIYEKSKVFIYNTILPIWECSHSNLVYSICYVIVFSFTYIC